MIEPGGHLRRLDNVVPEGETVAEREAQPCWCPDAFRDHAIPIDYCPRHGTAPDPDLWDHLCEPFEGDDDWPSRWAS